MQELVTMSNKELTRLEIIQKIDSKELRNKDAAEILGISNRHLRRLKTRYHLNGPAGLTSKKRGKTSNHSLSRQLKEEVVEILKSKYPDFGPTLATEKLAEVHGLNVSRESIRKLMMLYDLWKPKKLKKAPIYQLRPRRPCRGELILVDGSPDDWFEDRGPRANLLVFIDDATGELMALRFVEQESAVSYFKALKSYILEHGLPQALYTDKHATFRANRKNQFSGHGTTQFARALKELDVGLIYANTPQAKGRVERANRTLQDRLKKELRLQNISCIDEANAYLPKFMKAFNKRFGRRPQSSFDAHRKLSRNMDLDRILAFHSERTLTKNLILQYENEQYQIQSSRPTYALRKAKVVVIEGLDGCIRIEYKGKELRYSRYNELEHEPVEVGAKEINSYMDRWLKRKKPKAWNRHPWRPQKRTTDVAPATSDRSPERKEKTEYDLSLKKCYNRNRRLL